jgi:hypothetical protein
MYSTKQKVIVFQFFTNIFFCIQEPELEGSWFSEKGPQPEFSPSQENGTVIYVQLGYDVSI